MTVDGGSYFEEGDASEPLVDGEVHTAAAIKETGRYLPLTILGRGGMGEVWRVMDLELGRCVALKMVRSDQVGGDLELRLREEAQVTAQLQHPAIVPVYELGVLSDNTPYYTMREVSGETLSACIASWHASKDPEALLRLVDIIRQAAEAVGLAHARGVLHRDLKPANILVSRRGEVFVLDWGLVKVLGSATREHNPVVSERSALGESFTDVGQATGTPGYMSPEQSRGEVGSLKPTSDVFALGAVLYTALTNRAPSALLLVRSERWLKAAREGGRLPPGLATILSRAMAPDAEARYPDAAELAEELRRWLNGARQKARANTAVSVAEEAIKSLTGEQRRIADWVLGSLLDADGQVVAATLERAEVGPVIDVLEKAVMVQRADGRWELADTSLVEGWPRLLRLVEDREGRWVQATLRQAAAQLAAGASIDEVLLSEPALRQAEAWCSRTRSWLDSRTREVLMASAQARHRRQRRGRLLRRGAGVAVVGVILVFGILWGRAEEAREKAERAALSAKAGQLKANAGRAMVEQHPWTALALYRAAQDTEPGATPEPMRRVAATGVSHRVVPLGGGIAWMVSWSPDDQTVAVSHSDGGLSLVDAETGAVRTLPLFTTWTTKLVWMTRDRLIAYSRSMGAVVVDVNSGELMSEGVDAEAPVILIRPSDGARLTKGEGELVLTGLDGRGQGTLSLSGEVQHGDVSRDGRRIALLGEDQRLYVFDDGAERPTLFLEQLDRAFEVMLSHEGNVAAVFGREESAWLVDLSEGRVIIDLADAYGPGWVSHFCNFSDDGGQFACGTRDGRTRLVETQGGALLWDRQDQVSSVWTAQFSSDGRRVASGGNGGVVRIYDVATGQIIETLTEHTGDVKWLDWSQDGRHLAVALASGELTVWRPQSHRLRASPSCPAPFGLLSRVQVREKFLILFDRDLRACIRFRGSDRVVHLEPDTRIWVSSEPGEAVRFIRGTEVVAFDDLGHERVIERELPFHPQWWFSEGGRSWAASETGVIYRREEGGLWQVLEGRAAKHWIMIALNQDRLVTRDKDEDRLVLRHAQTGVPLREWGSQYFHPTAVNSVYLDQQRGALFTAGPTGTVYRWSLEDGAGGLIQKRAGAGSRLIRISQDGQTGISAGRNGEVEAWRIAQPERALWSVRLGGSPHAPLLSGDDRVFVGAHDGAGVWDLKTGTLLFWGPMLRGFTHFSEGTVMADLNKVDGIRVVWDLADLPEEPLMSAGQLTNLRVCRANFDVVPVIPFPAPEVVWAPDAACGTARRTRRF